ncbi:MAG TPA: hypothetical protein VIL78_18250 [Hanamia sp.]
MRKIILVFLISLIFLSCKKNIEFQKTLSYNVEDFRKPGMDDYHTLRAVYDSVPDESQIIFGNGTYTFSHSICLYKTLHLFGNNTVLKREDQITYTLKEPTDKFSNLLILNKTEGIIPGDVLFIAFDQSAFTTTSTNRVSSINGDSIYMEYPIGNTINNIGNFPIGTKVFKSINFFGIAGNISCSLNNLTFDGNRDNNQGSYSWLYNSAILAPIEGTTYYKNCKFINSPAETIVGHNADIRNCAFYDLNGSAFHTTADKAAESEGQIHSYLFDNTFDNTNQVPTEIGGHSEGAITHSNSGGYYTASNNTFLNVNGPVLGGFISFRFNT